MSDEEHGGAGPPPITREEFEEVWRADQQVIQSKPSPHVRELIRRYNKEVFGSYPISYPNLWRLEKLEAHAAWQARHSTPAHIARWDDPDQGFYERLLVTTLKFIHRARWRKAISTQESERILAAAESVLGEGVACASYPEKMPRLLHREDRPNSRQALATILGMLDKLAETRPHLRDRFMARQNLDLGGQQSR